MQKNIIKKFFRNDHYKVYTSSFDEFSKAEDLESDEELSKLRSSLDQQLLQLKILYLDQQTNYKENCYKAK